MATKRYMMCSCCGRDAGRWEQHWNRDTGYGICRSCVDWLISRGETTERIERDYGKEGVHYEAKARTGHLRRDQQERISYNAASRCRFVTAWRIVDAAGQDIVQPWMKTKGEARATAKELGIILIEEAATS